MGVIDQAAADELEKEHRAQAAQMSKELQADRLRRKEERIREEKLAREKAKQEAAEEAKRRAAEARREAEEEQRIEGIRAAEKMRAKMAADRMAASGDLARNDVGSVAAGYEEEDFDVGMRHNAMEFDAFDVDRNQVGDGGMEHLPPPTRLALRPVAHLLSSLYLLIYPRLLASSSPPPLSLCHLLGYRTRRCSTTASSAPSCATASAASIRRRSCAPASTPWTPQAVASSMCEHVSLPLLP